MFYLDQMFPTPVAIPFGGSAVLAEPLRLRQLAQLQRWLRAAVPHPLESARAELGALAGAELQRRGGELIRAGLGLPVPLFSPVGDALLASPEGRGVLALVALGPLNPGVDVRALAGRATEDEWSALAREWYAVEPVAELIGIVDPPDDGPADAGPANWGAIVADLAAEGRDLAELAEWTLGQLGAVRHRGERPGLLPRPRDGESLAEACARRRALMGTPDDLPADPDDPDTAEDLATMAALAAATEDGGA